MGDYDEMFEGKEEAEPEEKAVQFNDINLIINERNKLLHRLVTLKNEYSDEIGRLNLYLFGDPKNEEYQSKIDELEEEISNPMTKGHPMAGIAREVIRLVKEIQMKYKKLNILFSTSTSEIGTLLDSTIKLYDKKIGENEKDVNELKYKIQKYETKTQDEEELKEADSQITHEMVDEFMGREGHQVIEKYKDAITKGDRIVSMQAKGLFVRKAKDFFIGKHPDPKRVGNLLFDRFTKSFIQSLGESVKKIEPHIKGGSDYEPNQTEIIPLNENGKTRNSVDDEEEEPQ